MLRILISSDVRWQWEHRTGFKEYTAEQSDRIEVAYRSGAPKIRLKAGKRGRIPMEIFFGDMIQYDPLSENIRRVRRWGREGPLFRLKRLVKGVWYAWTYDTPWLESFAHYQARRRLIQKYTAMRPYDVSDYYHTTGWAQHLAKSARFQGLAMFFIVLSTVWQWYESDADPEVLWTRADVQFAVMNNLFCFVFCLELLIRWLAFKQRANCVRDQWFRFDCVLVSIMIVETWILPFFMSLQGGDTNRGGLAVLRVFRLMRLVRVARLFRAAPKLFAMLQGIVSVMRPVIYTMLLLAILMVIFAILFRTYIKAYPDDFLVVEGLYFSNCRDTFWTLLAYGTFMDGITIMLIDTLIPTSIVLTFGFLAFVLMSSFIILNMLIGIICEAILRVTAALDSEAERYYLETNLSELMSCYDKNYSESLGKREIDMLMSNPETMQCLTTFGTDVGLLKGALEFHMENLRPGEDGIEPEMPFKTFIDIAKRLRDGHTAKMPDLMEMQCYTSGRLDHMQMTLDRLVDTYGNKSSSSDRAPELY